MQTKKANCKYCGKNIEVYKCSVIAKAKCPDCWKIWHRMRTLYQTFGEGVTTDILVFWWFSKPSKCEECGSKSKLTIDRILPGSMGGKYELSNIQKLCYKCNCCKKKQFKSVAEGIADVTCKSCIDCEKEKPLTSEFWHKTAFKAKYMKVCRSMFHSSCKECRLKNVSREYMLKNKPRRLKKIVHKDVYESIYG